MYIGIMYDPGSPDTPPPPPWVPPLSVVPFGLHQGLKGKIGGGEGLFGVHLLADVMIPEGRAVRGDLQCTDLLLVLVLFWGS